MQLISFQFGEKLNSKSLLTNFVLIMKKTTIIIIFIAVAICFLQAQSDKKYIRLTVGFYNLENLLDTIDQPGIHDSDFTPNGLNKWNTEKYQKKLENMSFVISQIGNTAPSILGVTEIENRAVLEDLINMPLLKDKDYEIAHFDSPDERGIDVGLLYVKDVFLVYESKAHPVILPDGDKTRDILQVSGFIDGERFHIMVGHWPSRSGGEAASLNKRMIAANVMRHVTDSLLEIDKSANVILMGDFNDDPVSQSVKKGLKIKNSSDKLAYDDLFTPMLKLYKEGIGTLAYRDVWNLFDIIVVNGNLFRKDYQRFKIYTDPKTRNNAFVFNKEFLMQSDGTYKNYPFRTIVGGEYQGGYSDHFPVYIYLVKEVSQ